MPRAPLLALALALATVLGTAGGRDVVANPATGGGEEDHGWAPRSPGWVDPGPRARALATGDAVRGLPRAWARAPRPTRDPRGRVLRARPAAGPLLDLVRLGRRQTDGG